VRVRTFDNVAGGRDSGADRRHGVVRRRQFVSERDRRDFAIVRRGCRISSGNSYGSALSGNEYSKWRPSSRDEVDDAALVHRLELALRMPFWDCGVPVLSVARGSLRGSK